MLFKLTATLSRFLATAGVAGLLMCTSAAHAEDDRTKAMRNATQIATMLDGVVPEKLHNVIENLETGKLKRIAPNQPIWILETVDGTILYYQGQPSFKGQPASKLVDEEGNRFGLKALEAARQSRSIWLRLKLGEGDYRAYCRAQEPIVACSLIP